MALNRSSKTLINSYNIINRHITRSLSSTISKVEPVESEYLDKKIEFDEYRKEFYSVKKILTSTESSGAPANSEIAENKEFYDKSPLFSSVDPVASISVMDKKNPESSDSSGLSVESLRTPSSENPIRSGSEELAGTPAESSLSAMWSNGYVPEQNVTQPEQIKKIDPGGPKPPINWKADASVRPYYRRFCKYNNSQDLNNPKPVINNSDMAVFSTFKKK